jgi:hypothetical protein
LSHGNSKWGKRKWLKSLLAKKKRTDKIDFGE